MANPPPPIPEIGGDIDLLLEVYTHASLRNPSHTQMNAEYGDTDRLAELGANALDLAVTNHFYLARPILSGTEIHVKKNEITSDATLDIWLGMYRMKEKLKFAPTEAHILNDPVEMRKFFHIFLGAVFIRNGLPSIQTWISALIDWSTNVANHVDDAADTSSTMMAVDGTGNTDPGNPV